MAKVQRSGKKKRLGAAAKQTRWAPFWIIQKAKGKGKKMHPSSLTAKRRNWRRTKLQA
ncbi:MAG TPA: 50S ribosomal protein L39e [Candidatus Nanoarchaeia archaeon]|nr:50S ribosomal protein L39e [Candidatus Nanoarchaeia archaeon]